MHKPLQWGQGWLALEYVEYTDVPDDLLLPLQWGQGWLALEYASRQEPP